MNLSIPSVLGEVFASAALLPFLLKGAVNKEWRASLPERLGYGAWKCAPAVSNPIWFHAASMGEVGGLAPLFSAFASEGIALNSIFSTTSLTGRSEVLRRKLSSEARIFPFDHPRIMRSVLERIQPKAVVIAETEIWPFFLAELSRREIPRVIINARISDYSFPRYQRLSFLLRRTFQSLNLVCAQTALDAERFVVLGVDPTRVRVTGSSKYDQAEVVISTDERRAIKQSLGFNPDWPVFVAGSIRPGEDEIVLAAYSELKRAHIPELQMVFAPRHPERFEACGALLEQSGISFSKRSARSQLGASPEATSIVLLDTLGELRSLYAIGDVCFVGGTLVDIGGHNPLEPAQFGRPVIVGPYTANVRDAVQALRSAEGVLEVGDKSELTTMLEFLLHDESARERIGQNAYAVWAQNSGATARILKELSPYLFDEIFRLSSHGTEVKAI